jgi:hypothetical protein
MTLACNAAVQLGSPFVVGVIFVLLGIVITFYLKNTEGVTIQLSSIGISLQTLLIVAGVCLAVLGVAC